MKRILLLSALVPFVKPALFLSLKMLTDFAWWLLTPVPRVRGLLFKEL